MTASPSSPPPMLSRGKSVLFGAVFAVLLLVLSLALLEVSVRAVGLTTPDDPFINFGSTSDFFEDVKIDGVDYTQVKGRELYRWRNVRFKKQKDPGAFRIFCVGSSASAGWPHPPSEIYSAFLEGALRAAYPDRQIEIHNVSAHAYPSYRSRLIVNELINFQPDLIIVYAGNNEFIEPRHYSTEPHWYDPIATVARQSTAYRLIRGSRVVALLWPETTFRADLRVGVVYEQWSKIEQIPLALRTDPEQFHKLVEHYEYSISSMVKAAKSINIPILLLTNPVNLRDWRPNVSISPIDGEQKKAWIEAYTAGRAALLRKQPDQATAALQTAAKLNPEHAATRFYLGSALEAVGRLDEAYASYDRARNLDANPFRAITALNDVVRKIGKSYDNARLVDTEQKFREASAPYAPGFDMVLDYVHPTKRGNLVIARSVFDAISQSGMIGPPRPLPAGMLTPLTAGDPAYDSNKDYSLQYTMLILSMMMHQYDNSLAIVDRIMSAPDGFKTLDQRQAENVRTTREVIGELVKLEHKMLLGGTISQEEKDRISPRLDRLYQVMFANKMEGQVNWWGRAR